MHGLSDHRHYLSLPRHLPLVAPAEVIFPAGYPAGLFLCPAPGGRAQIVEACRAQVAVMVDRVPLYAPDPDAPCWARRHAARPLQGRLCPPAGRQRC